MHLRPMTLDDHAAVMHLLRGIPGICLSDADSHEAVAVYLQRNPNLSWVALVEDRIVGCLMAGHDGRRGYLNHLAVDPAFRQRGIGTALVDTCLDGLRNVGILKSHLDVLADNNAAHAFWKHRGWTRRQEIVRYSFVKGIEPNA